MRLHRTAANTTECSGSLLRPVLRAAYFPPSVWGVTHAPFQKQSGDRASRSGENRGLPYGRGNAYMKKASNGFLPPLKIIENRNLLAKEKEKEKAPVI